jgi:S-formylglutathione hydrolase FrmB
MRHTQLCALFLSVLIGMTIIGCGGSSTHLESHILVRTRFERPMNFAVLRAPPRDNVDPASLPVVVLLHGMGDDHLALDQHEVSQFLLDAMSAGRIPLAHFILPDGERGFYVNWADGKHPYEDHIILDVVRLAEDVLAVSPTRENRHIVGFSMGGQGAIRLALTYPDRFASATAFSTLIINEKEAEKLLSSAFMRWLINADDIWGRNRDAQHARRMDPFQLLPLAAAQYTQRFYLGSGTDESREFHRTMNHFKAALDRHEVESRYVRYEGGHGWRWWKELLLKSLAWTLSNPTTSEDEEATEKTDETADIEEVVSQ